MSENVQLLVCVVLHIQFKKNKTIQIADKKLG